MLVRKFFLSCVLGSVVCAATASTFAACAEGAQLDDDDSTDGGLDGSAPDATTSSSSSSSSSSSGGSSGASSGGSSGGSSGATPDCQLFINEVSPASTSEDYIELYNPDGCPDVDLTGYEIVYRPPGGSTDTVLFEGDSATMPGGDFFVVGMTAVSQKDATFVNGALRAEGGQLALKDGSSSVDEVAYGTGSGTYGEGSAAPAAGTDQSIGRSPDGHDTNDNSADFSVGNLSPGEAND